MKVLALFLISGLSLSVYAQKTEVFTTVTCTTVQGKFSGAKGFQQESTDFSANELKDILLGTRQAESAPTPYPSNIVVAPQVEDLQHVSIAFTSQRPFGFVKAIYFTLNSNNFMPLQVFCTISQVRTPGS